jgi:hypothetical protein
MALVALNDWTAKRKGCGTTQYYTSNLRLRVKIRGSEKHMQAGLGLMGFK